MAQSTHGRPAVPDPRDIVNRVTVMEPFQRCDDVLCGVAAGTHALDPGVRQLTEQLAIRILVKHHGWTMVAPGHMQRVIG